MMRVEPGLNNIGLQPPSATNESLGAPFRTFEFSDADFRRLQRMIFDYAGISLNVTAPPVATSATVAAGTGPSLYASEGVISA